MSKATAIGRLMRQTGLVRERMAGEDRLDPGSLFTDVYSAVPPILEQQRRELAEGLREV